MKRYYVMRNPTTNAVIITTPKYVRRWIEFGFISPYEVTDKLRKVS